MNAPAAVQGKQNGARAWWSLLKALLTVNLGLSVLRRRFKTKVRRWEIIGAGIALVWGGGFVMYFFGMIANQLLEGALAFGQPEMVLTFAHLAASIMAFILGLVFCLGTFFFSRDTNLLLSWPLRPRQIISAKFATVLVNEYISLLVILLPVYVLYGVKVPTGPWFIPAATAAFVLTPIIPVALASMLVFLLMRFVGGARQRDLLTVVGGLLGLVIAFGLQYVVQSEFIGGGDNPEAMLSLFQSAHGLSEMVASGYPPGLWTMQFVVGAGGVAGSGAGVGIGAGAGTVAAADVAAGLVALAKLLLFTGAAVFAMTAVGERVFVRAVQTGQEHQRRRRKAAASWESGSVVSALARTERRLFVRTPVFLLNGAAGFIVMPAIIVLPQIVGRQNITQTLGQVSFDITFGAFIIAGWLALASSVSAIASTAFSREGSRLWIVKSLPVSAQQLFLGKLLAVMQITLVGSLPGTAALLYALPLTLPAVAGGIALGVVFATLISAISLAVDMYRPLLDWTDPGRAMKSNMNSLFAVIAAALLAALVALVTILFRRWHFGSGALIASLTVLGALGLIGFWRWLSPRLDERLWRMGE